MNKVIFDNDAGSDIDDLYALAYIIHNPNLEVLGITTVAGNTQKRAQIVAKMLRLAGKDIPVYAGLEVPLAFMDKGTTSGADIDYRQNLTHYELVEKDDPEFTHTYDDAVEYILQELSAAQEPIGIIGTGPWSNIAEVIRRADAQQLSKIKSIDLMGGEVHQLRLESNVKCDPEAADIILRSKLPIFLGTWSPTRELQFTMAEIDALHKPGQSPFLDALYKGTYMWWENHAVIGKPGPVCYDVIPAVWAAGEREYIESLAIDEIPVELVGTYTRSMTVADQGKIFNAASVKICSNEYIAVSDSIDAEQLKQRFIELVYG
ncbi:MAG: nucleoside hydrolase [Planctomycetes bacterium]|nr:nucleoside hydrolase [Planctomycetota bacterium]